MHKIIIATPEGKVLIAGEFVTVKDLGQWVSDIRRTIVAPEIVNQDNEIASLHRDLAELEANDPRQTISEIKAEFAGLTAIIDLLPNMSCEELACAMETLSRTASLISGMIASISDGEESSQAGEVSASVFITRDKVGNA